MPIPRRSEYRPNYANRATPAMNFWHNHRMRALLFLLLTAGLAAQTIQKSNTTENLRGISVLANGVAWASGTHGTYLRTIDGGKSWQVGQVPDTNSLDFRDVEAFSPAVA